LESILKLKFLFLMLACIPLALAQSGSKPVVKAVQTSTNPQPTIKPATPLTPVQPEIPTAVQPRAPGQNNPQALNRIPTNVAIPEMKKIEYASNGFIEVAHALILIPKSGDNRDRELAFAMAAVQRAFQQRPALEEVDFSIFQKESYGGAGGPLPRMTGSILKTQLPEFLRITIQDLKNFDRIWLNDDRKRPTLRQATTEQETGLNYSGDVSGLKRQQSKQLQIEGGINEGLLFHGSPSQARIALTFDDAPHPLYAPLLLDILHRTHVRATFFCIGRNATAYPYFVRDMVKAGHEVANHTFYHVRLIGLSQAAIGEELETTNNILKSITGQPIKYFRPPGGRYSSEVLQGAFDAGLVTAFWTDDPADFRNSGEAILEKNLVKHLQFGGIILLHDNVLDSIQVLPQFLKAAFERGIHVDDISGMLDGI
jgi:peptidoglycan-N-acetylglucosamine deacetylase